MLFAKMHGLGNDFVMVDGVRQQVFSDLGHLAQAVCHRRAGIGADGLIILTPSIGEADFDFAIYNADGSQAEMCGNGIRCAALFARDQALTTKTRLVFKTLAGLIETQIIDPDKSLVKVNMGAPRLAAQEIPTLLEGDRVISRPLTIEGNTYYITLVSMGNPHCVIFVDHVGDFPVTELGPKIERHPLFPAHTNVEFIELLANNKMKMRVWERGCGETLACGTGACASVVAAVLNGHSGRETEVQLPFGSLLIKWREDGYIEMTGPAETVFKGEYCEPLL